MTPLAIEIMLHYHTRSDDFRDGDFSAVVREIMDQLILKDEMLKRRVQPCGPVFELTSKGKAYVAMLTNMPLPDYDNAPDNFSECLSHHGSSKKISKGAFTSCIEKSMQRRHYKDHRLTPIGSLLVDELPDEPWREDEESFSVGLALGVVPNNESMEGVPWITIRLNKKRYEYLKAIDPEGIAKVQTDEKKMKGKLGMYGERPVIKIGKYTIAKMTDEDKEGIWIHNTETDEGGQFRGDGLENAIDRLWQELF